VETHPKRLFVLASMMEVVDAENKKKVRGKEKGN
jgi:hypothetical protein